MNKEILELTEEVWAIYCSSETKERDLRVFKKAQVPLTTIAQLLAISCNCLSVDQTVDQFVSRYRIDSKMEIEITESAKNILTYATNCESANNRVFIGKCARLHLLTYTNIYTGKYEYPELPRNIRSPSALIDLASGPDFINFLPKLERTPKYYAVDNSLFATECIRQKAQTMGLENIIAINADIMKLQRSDIDCGIIETIRAKNIFAYVPKYLYVFQNYLGWIADFGRFVFAEQASDRDANRTFQNKLVIKNFLSLIQTGWGFGYKFGDTDNPLSLNTVTLRKNRQRGSDEEFHRFKTFYDELNRIYQYTI